MTPFQFNLKLINTIDAVRFSQSSRPALRMAIAPLFANTDIVVVGGEGVTAQYNTDVDELTGLVVFPNSGQLWIDGPIDLIDWRMSARVVGEGVRVVGFT